MRGVKTCNQKASTSHGIINWFGKDVQLEGGLVIAIKKVDVLTAISKWYKADIPSIGSYKGSLRSAARSGEQLRCGVGSACVACSATGLLLKYHWIISCVNLVRSIFYLPVPAGELEVFGGSGGTPGSTSMNGDHGEDHCGKLLQVERLMIMYDKTSWCLGNYDTRWYTLMGYDKWQGNIIN